MNRQVQAREQDDFDFCTCDVCIRELRRAAEKEALDAAAKQQLMVSLFNPACRFLYPSSIFIHKPGAFPSDGQDAEKWIKDFTEYGITHRPPISCTFSVTDTLLIQRQYKLPITLFPLQRVSRRPSP